VVDVQVGDEVVTEIDGIGRLVNTLVGDASFGRGTTASPPAQTCAVTPAPSPAAAPGAAPASAPAATAARRD
jgi:hypothetical protein